MIRRAIGRLAVIALTGTLVFVAVPALACSGDKCDDNSSPMAVSKHIKKIRVARRHHHGDDVARFDQSSSAANAVKSQAKVETKPNILPSDVADARAQMSSDDVKAKSATELAAQPTADTAGSAAQDPAVRVVNADELNDLDKAATDVTDLPKLPPSVADSRAEMHVENPSTWAQTSTVGKAFIAFGVMLTLASAARMFMA